MCPILAGSCRQSILSQGRISFLLAICCWLLGYLTTCRTTTNDCPPSDISRYLWRADGFTLASSPAVWPGHLACLLANGFSHWGWGRSLGAVCFIGLSTRWSCVVCAFTLTSTALSSSLVSCIKSCHWRKLPWLMKFRWSVGKSLPARTS